MIFYLLFSLLIIQRITELIIAKRNEKWMKNRGGEEHGNEHYPYIVALHVMFLISLLFEVEILQRDLTEIWYVLVPILFLTQILRYWSVMSLGYYWNIKIIIVPNDAVVCKGPYQFIKHPNYIVVAIEILLIPLLFHAYITALIFTLLNIVMMTIRIPTEERVLQKLTNYQDVYPVRSRLLARKR